MAGQFAIPAVSLLLVAPSGVECPGRPIATMGPRRSASAPGAARLLSGGRSAVIRVRFRVFRISCHCSSISSSPADVLAPGRGGRSQKRASGPRTASSRTIVSHPDGAGLRPSQRPPTTRFTQGRNVRDARTGEFPQPALCFHPPDLSRCHIAAATPAPNLPHEIHRSPT